MIAMMIFEQGSAIGKLSAWYETFERPTLSLGSL